LSTDLLGVVALTRVVVLQDDVAKYISDPTPPSDLKMYRRRGRAKRRSAAKSARVMIPSPLKTPPMTRMGKHSRSGFSYVPGSAALDCPISLSSSRGRLVWRLAFPRRKGGRLMWRGSVPPKN
jgi:hypothetical protein